ncbi:uncharacterized protein [Henckelia pumila]|uniref:uncharacterized protein n=1 Tax=Henckelia pumila TaxID=405737 RepID=UPI003C6DF2DB
MTTKPSFIKYFLPRSSASQLLIPSTFMHCIGGYLPEKIFLHDRYYNLWQIKTRKVGGKWYFKKGWQKFVEDNNILPRDSVVFDYCEEDLFIVKILAPNGCQTEGARKLVSMDFDSDTDEDGDGTEEVDHELRRRGNTHEENRDEIFSEDSEDEDDYIEDADYFPNKKIIVRQASSEESEDDDVGNEDVDHSTEKKIKVERDLSEEGREDGDDEAEDVHAYLPDQRIQVEHDLFFDDADDDADDDDDDAGDDDYDDDDDEEEEEEEEEIEGFDYLCEEREDDDNGIEVADYMHDEEVQNVAVSKAKRKTAPPLYPRYCGMEIFEKGLAAKPSNPYFVTKIKPTRTFDLFIPLPLIEDYHLDLPKPTMLLVDPEGREFQGKFKIWKDGRIVYSGQWKSLLRRNDIEIGDTCICEFLNGVQGLYLKISFLRTRT